MEKVFKPKTFDADAKAPDAEKKFRHFKTVFTHFVEESIPLPEYVPTQDADVDAAATEAIKKSHRQEEEICSVQLRICRKF